MGSGVDVGVGFCVGDGLGGGVGLIVGEGDSDGGAVCPTGIMKSGIMAESKLRMLRRFCAPFPFQVSNPLVTRFILRCVAEASRSIC
jgi:hypothetical protein